MAKIPLTIDPNYCADWGFWEGVRELIQNAKDAEESEGMPMSVEHLPRSNRLIINSEGVQLDHATLLLLGATSKTGGDQRGKFGEGFVLGTLALVRAGHSITIYNGEEVWRPVVEQAEDGPFQGQKLLVFQTRKLGSPRNTFSIEVENVSKEVWEETRKLFLFMTPPKHDEMVKLRDDMVLLAEDRKGSVFSRGIFVKKFDDLECGYDIRQLPLDRDRRSVDEWDLRWRLADIWKEAHDREPEKFSARLYDMVKRNTSEVKSLPYRADEKLVKSLREQFEKEHGDKAVPVRTMTESRELEALGAKPVMVNNTLQELLEKVGPKPAEIKERLKSEVKERHDWTSLDADEKAACLTWVERVTKGYLVATFNDPDIRCRYSTDEKLVLVSRTLLSFDPRTIVREVVRAEAQHQSTDAVDVLVDLIVNDR